RDDRAGSAGVREEQGGRDEGVVRLQGNQPARAEAARAWRVSRDLQLLVQRQRGDVHRRRRGSGGRRARGGGARGKTDAGTRSSDPRQRSGDVLPEVPDPEKGGVMRLGTFIAAIAILAPASRRIEPLTGMPFILVPAGVFEMGSPPGEKDREAQE